MKRQMGHTQYKNRPTYVLPSIIICHAFIILTSWLMGKVEEEHLRVHIQQQKYWVLATKQILI